MKPQLAIAWLAAAVLATGCAEMPQLGGPKYGETGTSASVHGERTGKITQLELIKVDEDYKFGIGTVAGAVAGGLLGSQIGEGRGSTVGAVVGAAAGAAAGTVAESKMKKKDAQRVTVQMTSGGSVTIVQPVDARLKSGMAVRIEGSGETARVVPR
ncbi:glycine zipper 2TM domain-containing protein [Thiobacter aerophilum]|uniref:Glycine zipper 2TM domain-containing protein n=1 Tax=Thiobacter aerophilum TaxID=3121275 RepID=A0ABV0EFT5_9BURK